MGIKFLITNNLGNWLEGCRKVEVKPTGLARLLDTTSNKVQSSKQLHDAHLSGGTAAALVEYDLKRKEPVIVTVENARLACVSLPTPNGELEEHYYFVNERGEWLTENPFLACYQYWFYDVERSHAGGNDYMGSTRYAIKEISYDTQELKSAIFLGGRMNWTHWNIDCLPELLIINPEKKDILITSKLTPWQIDSLKFFSINNYRRLQISNGDGISISTFKQLTFSWNFHQIDRFFFLRNKIKSQSAHVCDQPEIPLLLPDLSHNARIQRIINSQEIIDCARKYCPMIVTPSKMSYSEKKSVYGLARNIVTLPGSDSINALLFGKDDASIFQMMPWPNNLFNISMYSLIIAYRQMAYQSYFKVNTYFGYSRDSNTNFDNPRYYPPEKLDQLMR